MFGPKYTHQTITYVDTLDRSAQSLNSWCIRTVGDPTITVSSLQNAITKQLSAYNNLSSIKNVMIDDTLFTPSAPFPTSWEWEDVTSSYGAAPTAPIINENTVRVWVTGGNTVGDAVSIRFDSLAEQSCTNFTSTLTTSSTTSWSATYRMGSPTLYLEGQIQVGVTVSSTISLIDPSKYFACIVKYSLQQKGVRVDSAGVRQCAPTSGVAASNSKAMNALVELGSMSSLPLSVMMNHTLQESDNLFAEHFLLTVGSHSSQKAATTLNAGIAETLVQLKKRFPQFDSDALKQKDGSGVSAQGMLTPNSLIQLFEGMVNDNEWRSYLPVSGRSGTLINRFKGTPAEGIVQAKTGSLTGVNSLSGYMTPTSFPTILFSIINNHNALPASVVRQAIDDIVVLLTRLVLC